MQLPRSSMDPGSEAYIVCVSVASVSAFAASVAIIFVLVWLRLRQVPPVEREGLERQISDLQRQVRDARNQKGWRNSSRVDKNTRLRGQDEGLENTEMMELEFKDPSKARESIANLKKQLEDKNRELDDERRQRQTLSKRNELLSKEIQDFKTQSKVLVTAAKSLPEKDADRHKELQRTQRTSERNEELRQAIQTSAMLSTQVTNMREWEIKLEEERKRYQDLVARNQYLQDELKAARKYGSKEDRYAGAEVIEKVEKLNSDILQVAATMAEALDVDAEWENDRHPVDNAGGPNVELEAIIGRDLTRLLRTSENQDLNILLQMAFQASMAYHAMSITSSWCYKPSQEEELFYESYKNMQKEELQVVFGRWRQLAITHLKGSRSANEQHLMPRLATTLADIVIVAGYRQDRANVVKQIHNRFGGPLEEVIKAAQDLHRIMGEDITSCDIKVVWLRPGTSFDPGLMEDSFGPKSINKREEVACVTDIGLRSIEKVSGSMERKDLVLLKAKVLLPSGLAGIRVRDTVLFRPSVHGL